MSSNPIFRRKRPLLLLAVVLVLVTIVGCGPTVAPEATKLPTDGPTTTAAPVETNEPANPGFPRIYRIGDKVEDFTVTMSDGKKMTLSEILQTKELVILNFWATWCGPCRMEFPFMEEAYLKHQDQVEIIALSVEPADTNKMIEAFKKTYGLTALPMGQDTIGLSSRFYFRGIPTSVAIDRFGVVCWQESGAITSTDKFERLFSGFLGEDYTESKVNYEIPGPSKKDPVPTPDPEGIPEGMARYTVRFVDQNGDPVANVMAQVCDVETCEVLPSDENGVVTCVKAEYAYEIHVLKAPEGYTFDTEKVYVMPAEGGELVIKGTKN